MDPNTIKTTDDIFEHIALASLEGRLGFFIGAGFSKAVLAGDSVNKSFSWAELLKECYKRLFPAQSNLSVCEKFLSGVAHLSYPDLASEICKKYVQENASKGICNDGAIKKFKETICELTRVYPDDAQCARFSFLNDFNLSWIITTNYDTICESILGATSISVSPTDNFEKINGIVPVYHLHGIHTDSDSIVITTEDYAKLFRPGEYRQARLPFLLKESLVVMIGYGLGDINVHTALDWCKNVYRVKNQFDELPIIQFLYIQNRKPNDIPYNESGIWVLEYDNLESLFKELKIHLNAFREKYNIQSAKIDNFLGLNCVESQKDIDRFINNESNQRIISNFFKDCSLQYRYLYRKYLTFLKSCIQKIDLESQEKNNFEAYNKKLKILLNILEVIPVEKMPVPFFRYVADELNNVMEYLGQDDGDAWVATDTWTERRKNILDDNIDELYNYSKHSELDKWWKLRESLKPLLKNNQ